MSKKINILTSAAALLAVSSQANAASFDVTKEGSGEFNLRYAADLSSTEKGIPNKFEIGNTNQFVLERDGNGALLLQHSSHASHNSHSSHTSHASSSHSSHGSHASHSSHSSHSSGGF